VDNVQQLSLPHAGPAVLALGGHLKNTVCLTRGDAAFVSAGNGDLDTATARVAMEDAVTQMMAHVGMVPMAVVHDLHPDYYSTRFAAGFAAAHGIPLIAVQHHHAHIAAIAAEHGVGEPLLGLALDGVGYGADGGAWGGELLRVDGATFERLGHLRELPLPGGDRAAREPWRMAAAVLHLLGRGAEIERRWPAGAALRQMLEREVNCLPTSSCGRWFDAAAGLLRVKDVAGFEGEAAMLLEGQAAAHGPVAPWADGYAVDANGTLDLMPLLARLADEQDIGHGAALFHATLAAGLAQWTLAAVAASGIRHVALGGGCFLNRVMSLALRSELEVAGVTVLEARQVSPGDAGIALGQAWAAICGAT
jgi:hydrogenase maturation protein HypF